MRCLIWDFGNLQMREAVRDVAKYFPTAIVTGRCTEKVHLILEQINIFFNSFILLFFSIRKFFDQKLLQSSRVKSNVIR